MAAPQGFTLKGCYGFIPHQGEFEQPMKKPETIRGLRVTDYRPQTVKQEMRRNLVGMIERGENLFPGIVGYEKTVLPQIENALMSGHDFILLGLRGQAKT